MLILYLLYTHEMHLFKNSFLDEMHLFENSFLDKLYLFKPSPLGVSAFFPQFFLHQMQVNLSL